MGSRTSIQEPSPLPSGWTARRLEEVARIHPGGRLGITKGDYVTEGYLAYSAAGQDGKVAVAEFEGEGVVLSSIGARCGKCFLASDRWTTLANTQVILPNDGQCDARFLWQYVNDEAYWHRSGSAQPFIKPSDVKGAWVALPPLEEQRRIAATLMAVDDAVASCEAVRDQLDRLRRALVEDLVRLGLPGDRVDRPRDSAGEPPPHWVEVPVTSLVSKPPRATCPAVQTLQYQDAGRFPVIDQGKAAVAGYVDDPSLLYSGPRPVIVFGDHTREWKYVDHPFAVGADGTQLLVPSSEVHPRFLFYALSALPIRNLGYARHFKLLKEMTVRMPPDVAEQRRISEVLEQVEAAGSSESRHLGHLKTLKSALGNDLLTGKLRVPDQDVARITVRQRQGAS